MKMTHEKEILKKEKLDSLFDELREQIRQDVDKGSPIHEMELVVWKHMLQIGHAALEQVFELLGSGDQGENVTLPDGRVVQRLEQTHERRYVSIFGEFQLQRTVYGSREGQKIEFVPLDNRLELPDGPFSYVLQDWDQSFCVEQAFGPSAKVIERMLGIRQSVDSLERMNADMAKQVGEYRDARPTPKPAEEGEILVTSADGKGVVMRRSAEEKKPGRRRKGDKASQKRMATVAAIYSVNRYVRTPEEIVAALFRDEAPPQSKRPEPQQKHVTASLPVSNDEGGTISGIDIAYSWLQDEVDKRRLEGQELLHLGDGQESLWTACHRILSDDIVDILDLLHASSRVWQAAHVFYKEGSAEAEEFVRERLLRILQGHSDLVVRGLRVMASKRKMRGTKKRTLAKICTYLESNRERMHYDEYLAKGYPIASGVIEGACRHLVKDRMERAGMHWTVAGAQAMLDVRSIYIEDAWEPYQAFRIKRETKRLYPLRKLVKGSKYRLAA